MRPRDAQRLDWESRSRSCRSGISYPPAVLRRQAARRRAPPPCQRGTRGGPSLNDLIRPRQHRRRDGQAERLGGLEVDDELELGRLLDREIGGLGTLEDLCHIGSGASIEISEIRAVAHEGACLRPRRGLGDSREAVLRGKLKETRAEWSSDNMHPKGIGPL